jgi:cobaltochelatase CobT
MTERMIDAADFENASVAAARTFGRRGEVNVVFSGQHAMTDGSTIYIPSLDHTKQLDEETARVTRGFIDHEAGHIRHTDMKAFTKEMERAHANGDKFHAMLLNCIEDVRIEDCVRSEYPGAERNISGMNEKLVDSVVERMAKVDAADPRISMPIAIVAADMERNSVPGVEKMVASIPKPIMDMARDCIGMIDSRLRRVVERVEDGVTVADGKPGTNDAIELTRIISAMVDEKFNPDRKKEKGEGDGEGEGDGDEKSEGDEEGEGKGKEGESKGKPPEGKVDTKHSSWVNGHVSAPIDNKLNLREVLKHNIGGTRSGYTRFGTSSDRVHTIYDAPGKYKTYNDMDMTCGRNPHMMSNPDGRASYQSCLRDNAGAVGVMARKLERALMDKLRRGWQRNLEDGSFDSRRVVGAVRGEANIYRMRDDAPSLDTAVTLLIDLSGSMSGKKADVAMQSAICLAECLHRVGVSFEVLGFSDRGGFHTKEENKRLQKLHAESVRLTRWEPIDLFVFKEFDERLPDARMAMGNIYSCVGGNNSDGEHVLNAHARLMKRTEKRKIMIVLSDGSPACRTHDSDGLLQHLRYAVDYCERKGTKMIGIGICDDSVSRFYPKYTVINDVTDLGKATLDQVGRMILGERFKVDNADLIAAKRTA